MEQRTITTDDGVALSVWVRGDLTVDTPLLLVHGYTGSTLDWTDVVDALAADRPVVTYDVRGHGESGRGAAGSYRIERLVADLATVVDELAMPALHLLGHSLGGMTAMRYALDHPGGLASLVLMDTSPAPVVGRMRTVFGPAFELAATSGMASVLAMIEPYVPPGPTLDRMRTKFAQLDATAFIELADELEHMASVKHRLPELTLPTTVVVGALDEPFRAPSDVMAAAIHGAHLDVIDGAAHSPQEERPDAWLAAIDDHFRRTAAT
jgi:pimeloyl-ACP methyl ester carboxylesterase